MTGPDKLEGFPQHPPNISSSRTAPSKPENAQKTTGPSHTTDSVDLSPENIEYTRLLKRIDEVPDIRQERIEEIQEALEDGTYNIDPLLVAEGIVQEIISESLSIKKKPDTPDSATTS